MVRVSSYLRCSHVSIFVFLSKLPWEQETPLHNRWHPDIPPVASVVEGETFRVSYSLLVVLVSLIVTLHTTAKL